MDPLLKGAHKKKGGKTVGVKLSENDLAVLNLRLRRDSFETFSEFVHAYIDSKYSKYEMNEQTEKLLERIRDREIRDPLTGDFTTTIYKTIDKEDMLRDFLRKYIYKKHTRDLIAYYNRYIDIFFKAPAYSGPVGACRGWICDSIRCFVEYYDRKY